MSCAAGLMPQIDRSQNISQREMHRPSFVTFTGVDERTSIAALQGLSGRYPIEWGVLLHPHPPGPLFPNADTIEKLRGAGLRLSAHVCDSYARDIAAGEKPRLNLAGFSRVQVNHGRNGATEEVIANVQAYAASQGLRAALQCSGAFPADGRVDWLYDVSFGAGVKPSAFPALSQSFPLCGFAGGSGRTMCARYCLSDLPWPAAYPSGLTWSPASGPVLTWRSTSARPCVSRCLVEWRFWGGIFFNTVPLRSRE